MLYLRGKSVRWRLVTKLVVFGVAITTISVLYFQATTLHVRLHLLLQPSYYVPILVAALRF